MRGKAKWVLERGKGNSKRWCVFPRRKKEKTGCALIKRKSKGKGKNRRFCVENEGNESFKQVGKEGGRGTIS